MPEVIFKLLPEAPKPDEDRIAALTLAIEKKQRRLDAVMEQWSHDESITTQETARRQIKRLSAEIDVDKAELVEARSRARIIQHDDRAGVGDRVQKARSMMLNRDAEIRFQARAKLAQELRHILNSVVLHPDRSFDLRYNDGHLGETLLELSLTTDRIVGVRSMFPDGRTFMQLNDLIAMDRLSFEIGFEAFGILVEAMQNPEVEAPVDG
jgi:hypothetical protein